MTPRNTEPHILFTVCAYEAIALIPGTPIPTITSKVDPLPWVGRAAVWAGFAGYFLFHFRVIRWRWWR